MASATSLAPTFYGHIASSEDALLLFEACLSRTLNHLTRRPYDRERKNLIKSGNVFIYEEHSSSIKRWTDGVSWSPSRTMGNFLVYRELERPYHRGEKKQAKRRGTYPRGINIQKTSGGSTSKGSAGCIAGGVDSLGVVFSSSSTLSAEVQRSLVGSLVDSYEFKEGGLIKKTVSVTFEGLSHHLVSYYTIADVLGNKFNTPSTDPGFQHISPRYALTTNLKFPISIDEGDSLDPIIEQAIHAANAKADNGYERIDEAISYPPMPLSAPRVAPGICNIDSTDSAPYVSLVTAYPDTYKHHHAPAWGVDVASKNHPSETLGCGRQEWYGPVVEIVSDSTTGLTRCPSNFEQQNLTTSSLSGILLASIYCQPVNESGGAHQGLYGDFESATETQQSFPD